MIEMTRDIMHRAMSSNGGWSNAQFNAIGVTVFKPKGWKKKLIGLKFPESQLIKFVELKDAHLNSNKKKIPGGYTKVLEPLTWEEQYQHPNWQRRRLEIMKRDKFKCRLCLDKDTLLHVHHLKYDKSKWIWEIHEMYLVTLCHACHEKEHGRKL